jgi:hypothetical protein
MTFAHIMGLPIEESALALAPAGAAILSGAAVIARSKLAQIVGWLRRSLNACRGSMSLSETTRREGAGGWP